MPMTVGEAAGLLGVTAQDVLNRPQLLRTLSDPTELLRIVADNAPTPERRELSYETPVTADDMRDAEALWEEYAATMGLDPFTSSTARDMEPGEELFARHCLSTGIRYEVAP
jgi:hypothetical protein